MRRLVSPKVKCDAQNRQFVTELAKYQNLLRPLNSRCCMIGPVDTLVHSLAVPVPLADASCKLKRDCYTALTSLLIWNLWLIALSFIQVPPFKKKLAQSGNGIRAKYVMGWKLVIQSRYSLSQAEVPFHYHPFLWTPDLERRSHLRQQFIKCRRTLGCVW